MEHVLTILVLIALAAGGTAAALPLAGRTDTTERRARREAQAAEELAALR